MTNTRFDALASKPGRAVATLASTQPRRRRLYIVRIVWLTALFARRESATIADYRRRFGVSVRSFRRDLAVVRQAGFDLETTAPNSYRMLCFDRKSDAPVAITPTCLGSFA